MLKDWIAGEEVLVRPEWMFICSRAKGGIRVERPVTCGGEPLMLKNRPDATQQPREDFFLVLEDALAHMFHRTFLPLPTASVSQTAYISFCFLTLPTSRANTSSSKNFGTLHPTRASAQSLPFIKRISDLFLGSRITQQVCWRVRKSCERGTCF